MSTLNVLNTLLGIINARNKNVKNYKPGLSAVTNSAPSQPVNSANTSPSSNAANPNDPLNPANNPSTSPVTPQTNPNSPQQQPVPPAAPQGTNTSPNTEDHLRQQLQQADPYDLNGEKTAAEAMKQDEAFKQQQIQQKADETKQFFAEQDRKQEQAHQEIQKQADQQLQEQAQKEFWNQKQQQEMQAGMDKELQSLHEGAKQAHQEWRNDFTQGICRDDAAALYNKDIQDRTMAYKERLDDLGTNPVQANETIAKYQVKLQDEAAPQIEQKAAELHQEHFPDYASGPQVDRHGPEAHGPEHPPEAEHPEAESPQKPSKTGPGITYPQGGPQYNMPGLGGRESIRPAPEVPPQAQVGNGSGSEDSTPPSESAARPTDPQTMFEDTWQARAKVQDRNDPDVRFENEHPVQDKVIKSGLAALDEASGQSVLNKQEGSIEPDAVDVDHADDGIEPEDPKRIYGEGEKEFNENAENFGRKTAENIEAAKKIGEAAGDVLNEKIEKLNEDAHHGGGPGHDGGGTPDSDGHLDGGQPDSMQTAKYEIPGGAYFGPGPGHNGPTPGTDSTQFKTFTEQPSPGSDFESQLKDMHNPTDHLGQAVIGVLGVATIVKNKYGDSIKDFGDKVAVAAGEAADKALDATQNAVDAASAKVNATVDSMKDFGGQAKQALADTKESVQQGVQELRDNLKVSSGEALDKLAQETKSSLESDQNKLLQQVEFADKHGLNPNLADDYAKILQERGRPAEEVNAGVNKINDQIQKVEQENRPPAPAPAPNVAPQPTTQPQQQPQQQSPAPSLSQSFNSVA